MDALWGPGSNSINLNLGKGQSLFSTTQDGYGWGTTLTSPNFSFKK